MSENYELYTKIVDIGYDMAEIYIENSDPKTEHTLCSDKGLKLIQNIFDNVKDEYKEIVFKQFLEELQEREVPYEPAQFYEKVN